MPKVRDTKQNGDPGTQTYQDIYEGKIPPYSKELEMNVLGGMIIDNSLIDTVITILKPKHFYDTRHSLIYKAAIEMRDRNEPIDLLTLTEELKSRGELEKVGGPLLLSELATSFSTLDSIVFSAKKVLEYWVKRDLIKLTFEIREMCLDPTSQTESLLDKAQHEILDVTNYLEKKSYSHVRDEVRITMEYVESIHEKGSEIFGVPSGYKDLDAITGGFQKSELIVIAGRPSHGKTALALNISRNAAIDYGKSIGIFSIEMSNRELALRFLCLEARVDILKLKTGKLPQTDWDKIANTSPIFYNPKTNIIIDDTSPLGLLEVRAKARRMKSEYGIDMVIVDYLQLMEVTNLRRQDNRYIEIGYITRGLKELSKELDIPVVALSQLSRKVEDRGGKEKKPMLSDLRESGSIEQDADVVIFINRPEIYLSREEREREERDEVAVAVGKTKYQGLAEIIIGKQRNGPIGEVDLTFIKSYAKFEPRSKDVEPQYYTSRSEPPF